MTDTDLRNEIVKILKPWEDTYYNCWNDDKFVSDILALIYEKEDLLVSKMNQLDDAAEMLWTVVANVGGGNWDIQSKDWQEAACRWRDNYFEVRQKLKKKMGS